MARYANLVLVQCESKYSVHNNKGKNRKSISLFYMSRKHDAIQGKLKCKCKLHNILQFRVRVVPLIWSSQIQITSGLFERRQKRTNNFCFEKDTRPGKKRFSKILLYCFFCVRVLLWEEAHFCFRKHCIIYELGSSYIYIRRIWDVLLSFLYSSSQQKFFIWAVAALTEILGH